MVQNGKEHYVAVKKMKFTTYSKTKENFYLILKLTRRIKKD